MKTQLSVALKGHYASGTTSIATCWKCTLGNGTVLGFTSHDADIVYSGVTYLASSGLITSNTESQTKLAVDNAVASGLLDSDVITADDLAAGVWDFAKIEIFHLNWADTSMGPDKLITGRLGEVQIKLNAFSAELRGLSGAYQHSVGQIYQPMCRATLGDARCGFDMNGTSEDDYAYESGGTIEAVSDTGLVLTDSSRLEPGPAGGVAITGITNALAAVVTAPAHGLEEGAVVYVSGVVGMAQINGLHFAVQSAPTADTLVLAGADSREWDTYTSGGEVVPRGDSGWWDYGVITMLTGASAGLEMEIKAYSPGTITLQLQFPRGVEVGDAYSIKAGCGKRFLEDCVARFNNGINFRGEPHVIGMDNLMRMGGQ